MLLRKADLGEAQQMRRCVKPIIVLALLSIFLAPLAGCGGGGVTYGWNWEERLSKQVSWVPSYEVEEVGNRIDVYFIHQFIYEVFTFFYCYRSYNSFYLMH